MNYSTKNKTLLLNLFESHKDVHLNIEEIDNLLHHQIPLASLYRIIDKLEKEGTIRKYVIDNSKGSCYQYNGECEHNHFHLLCSRCGKLIHLHCHEVDNLISHIYDEHNFKVDINKVNLYGLCEECARKENR